MEPAPLRQSLDLSAKVAIVTGGAWGIGYGIAYRLAEAGASVVIADMNGPAAHESAAKLVAKGWKATAAVADVSDSAQVAGMVATAVQAYGALDILDQNKDIVELVARVATEWDNDKAFAGLTNSIQANPDINFLIVPSDSEDALVEQALKTAGKWHKTGEEGHVLFAGFDGDQNGYNLLSTGYMDVNGVQNLFYEVDLAYGAFKDLWAGKHVDKLLIDPGFAISQATLAAKRDEMWGYHVWKQKNG